MKTKQNTIKRSDLRQFIKSNYISEIHDDGSVELSEDYDYMNLKEVAQLIRRDVNGLTRFLQTYDIAIDVKL